MAPDIANPINSRPIGDDADHEIRKRIGQAIRACRFERATQDEVAERTGIGQSTLSAYEQGRSVPTLLGANAIERACGRPDGWIAATAGLVADIRILTIREAVEADQTLPIGVKRAILNAVEGAVESVQRGARR